MKIQRFEEFSDSHENQQHRVMCEDENNFLNEAGEKKSRGDVSMCAMQLHRTGWLSNGGSTSSTIAALDIFGRDISSVG